MTREEIRNKIFEHLKQQVAWTQTNPNQTQQFQLSQIYTLFPMVQGEAQWQHHKIDAITREIIQELENGGFIYEGQAGGLGDMSSYPWYTITEYGKEAILQEDWSPYDPEGYLNALKAKIPVIDDVTLTYIGETVAAYNRRHLLSATLTIGVASENLMLLLIEAYTNWIPNATRKASFQNKVNGRFISTQYGEFKKEFVNDLKSLPVEFQVNWGNLY